MHTFNLSAIRTASSRVPSWWIKGTKCLCRICSLAFKRRAAKRSQITLAPFCASCKQASSGKAASAAADIATASSPATSKSTLSDLSDCHIVRSRRPKVLLHHEQISRLHNASCNHVVSMSNQSFGIISKANCIANLQSAHTNLKPQHRHTNSGMVKIHASCSAICLVKLVGRREMSLLTERVHVLHEVVA